MKLEVEVDAKPDTEIKWYKDGELLCEGDKIKFTNNGDGGFGLEVDDVKPEDIGKYSCVVSNPYGQETGSSNVVLIGKLIIFKYGF